MNTSIRLFLSIISLFLLSITSQGQNIKVFNLKEVHKITDSISTLPISNKAPLIGISASNSGNATRLAKAYSDAVIKAGATPLVIPIMTDSKTLLEIVKELDGLILSGGGDINPPYYKEEANMKCSLDIDTLRDEYELILFKLAYDRNIPMLGICRGQQLINAAMGGTLYQDINTQYKKTDIAHKQSQPREDASHSADLIKGTRLYTILDKKKTIEVNSIHHQSVKDVAPGFIVSALSTDGIVEGIESPDRNIMCVQWHPEAMIAKYPAMLNIFTHLIGKASAYQKAKDIHSRIISVDTHTDTPLCFTETFNIAKRDSNQINLPKMREGYLDAVYMAAYLRQGKRDSVSSHEAVEYTTKLINGIHKQVEMNKDACGIAYKAEDAKRLKSEGKKAIYIGIENGYGIGKDIKNLAKFKDMGVSYMTLCHNYDNDICDAASKSKKEWGGLSPYGREVVAEMNRIGMAIDVSHVGESTFWQLIKLSKAPIIASHSSADALCNNPRNLTDNQLRAIAKIGGVVQVCPVDMFVNINPKKATLDDFMNHIDHVVKVAGIDHAGIGSDFDGGGGVLGCQGANDLINITVKLIERGYSEKDIEKIWSGNYLRVLNTIQSAAGK